MFINEGIFVCVKMSFRDFVLKIRCSLWQMGLWIHYLFVANYFFMSEAGIF